MNMEENIHTATNLQLQGNPQLRGEVILTGVRSESTGGFTTSGSGLPGKYGPRIKSLREKFLTWVISWMLPGFHLAQNPPKGYKRPRKAKEVINENN
jgi:hypothetical protein